VQRSDHERLRQAGFDPQQNDNVFSGLGQKQTVVFRLRLAQSRQTIEVGGAPPLINPADANTSTNLDAPALENLPNPGGDLTYPLQFAPGALINTAGSSNDFVGATTGYGNVEFNGLPALSNGYIVDGIETNDPLTNLNIALSTNLVLGLNAISEVTVNTLSYSVDQGRYGASQVNYVTKSGSNQFHGNLYEIWNGSVLNAANFFSNATGTPKARSVVNHFGGSLGGPIVRDKLFFFSDSESVKIALPIVSPAVIVPTVAFQNYVLQQLPLGLKDPNTGAFVYAPAPQEVSFYQKMFALYANTSGTPYAIPGCPFSAGGIANAGCANKQTVSHSSLDDAQVQTARVDWNIDEQNTAWLRFEADWGLQVAYSDPINPFFNSLSPQPQNIFASGYTHVFSSSVVNHFNPGFSWYSSIFAPRDFRKTLAAFPIVFEGAGGVNTPFTTLGGLDNTWVQGRRASRFFINDNLAWSRHAHEFRFGTNTRVLRLNDYDVGQGTVPLVTYTDLSQFIYGVASTATKTFPVTGNEPFNFLNLDLYAQDTWKVTPTLTWTIGIRDALNSNPLDPHHEIARLHGSFDSISHDVNQPLNAAIQTQKENLFDSTPLAILQPRTALAWQFARTSVLRTGFGLFSDILPGSIADLVDVNPPYVRTFQGGLLGTVGTAATAIAPGVPNSAIDALAAADQAFSAGFASGELSCASPHANPAACLPPVAITALPTGKLHAPYSMQWSVGVEHQFGSTASLRAQYVGTRVLNQPYITQVNGYQTVCQGCFAPFPYQQPTDPRFGAVTQFATGANSHYNGLQLSAAKRVSHGVQFHVAYTFGKSIDTLSASEADDSYPNGLFNQIFFDQRTTRGLSDFNVAQTFVVNATWEIPGPPKGSKFPEWAVSGWQLVGLYKASTGQPFTPIMGGDPVGSLLDETGFDLGQVIRMDAPRDLIVARKR
jgi:hypothetical protein